MKLFASLFFIILSTFNANSQQPAPGNWRGIITRADSNAIIFTFDVQKKPTGPVFTIHNADERIAITNVSTDGDTLVLTMPVFESRLRVKANGTNELNGFWVKDNAKSILRLPFHAKLGVPRFPVNGAAKHNISGRWFAVFDNTKRLDTLIGEFKQKGNILTGSFLTTTGDYRYLEGVVSGDSLKLSAFDGSHAMYFSARIANDSTLTGGFYASGATAKESWTARKDANASLRDDASAVYVKQPNNP